MSSFEDINATVQVIGSIMRKPQFLDQTDKYWFNDTDFPTEFYKIVFGSIYRLYTYGTTSISIAAIEDFLAEHPKSQGVFKANNGEEFLIKAEENAQVEAFDFYYNRLKKMTLLREYDKIGVDVTSYYDPNNILDVIKKEKQENWLDKSSLEDIANAIDSKISSVRQKFVAEDFSETCKIGTNIHNLIDKFKVNPEVGIPLYGSLINTVTRGARLKKFYLRSAPTGMGKTRMNAADAAYLACDKIYDDTFGWIKNGIQSPTLFIATEQELEEVQTLILAFLSGVNEEHILNGKYEEGEENRVREAAAIMEQSPLYITTIPDFSIRDIENIIRNAIREFGVKYVVYDYIHTSMKILEEITRRSGGIKLREDNVLFMMSTKLKDICNMYGIFLLSSTQLNEGWKESKTPDQNLLRGAKSIADKIDFGCHLLPVTEEDLKALANISDSFEEYPSMKISVYKNRRGKYTAIYLWCKADLGTCRVSPMFATTWSYDLISIDNITIEVEENSVF